MTINETIKFLENRILTLEAGEKALFDKGDQEYFNSPYKADIESTKVTLEALKNIK